MRKYVVLWSIITIVLLFEYYALTFMPELSLLARSQKMGLVDPAYKFSTQPGRTLSLWLGWVGLGLMVIMNVYSFRKRFAFMNGFGPLGAWLNFHIFCGILGPTLIFFHCGFKVRGVVGISFWSMVISFSSGIIGRYFFTQIGARQSDFEKYAGRALVALDKKFAEWKLTVDAKVREEVIARSLAYVGAVPSGQEGGLITTLARSITGDLRIAFSDFQVPTEWPGLAKDYLYSYAMNIRKMRSIGVFQRLMGYWHAFHFPFAIFMYIAAAIHVAASMIFLGMLG